jgi:hypothetical protein
LSQPLSALCGYEVPKHGRAYINRLPRLFVKL